MNSFKFLSLVFSYVLFVSVVHAETEYQPWRLNSELGLPSWFSLSGQHRTRFENLDEQYRGTRNGGDQALVFRTLLLSKLNFDRVKFAAEMLDSRA